MIDKNELIKKVAALPTEGGDDMYVDGQNTMYSRVLELINSLPDIDLNAIIEEAYSKGYENGSYKGTLKYLTEMTKGSDLAALKLKYNVA